MSIKDLICRYHYETQKKPTFQFPKWCLAVALLLLTANSHAQDLTPADTVGQSYAEALSRTYNSTNAQFLATLKTKTDNRKLLKYYQSRFKEIFKTLNEKINERQVIYIPEISGTLENILQEIKKNNPAIPKDIEVLLLREDLPNAYSLGNNSVFVNLGLFYYMKSEDQVATVLCHEIGHLLMEHTLQALQYSYERDKQSTTEVKSLRETELRKADRAFELLRNSIYKEGEVKREHEIEADSMGYLLFKNTRYDKAAFMEALKIIEPYDTLRYDGLKAETYKRFFDLPSQKFKDGWLKPEDFSSYNYSAFTEKLNDDSVASHPAVRARIQHLKSVFPELAQQQDTLIIVVAPEFARMQSIAEKQRLPNLFFNERYGEVIYLALLHLQEDADSALYAQWLGKGFQKIYEARHDYKLNKYLDRVAPKEQTKSYITFLSFMWNLKLDEIEKIASYYNQSGT
jgi:Zn-dependent protease with chaperone function